MCWLQASISWLPLALPLAGRNQGGAIKFPRLKRYLSAFMMSAADELVAAEKISAHLVQLLNGYGVERDATRECLKRGGERPSRLERNRHASAKAARPQKSVSTTSWNPRNQPVRPTAP